MAEPALVVSDLVVRYGERTAVDGLSFQVPTGSVCALLGPNGAGKSTTVGACVALRQPSAGRVRVLGEQPGSPANRARVGYQPQEPGVYAGARVAEMLRHVAALYAEPMPVSALLAHLGLAEVSARPTKQLSGGQRQRLSLALALVGRPALAFLDEPTAGLDVQARRATWQLIRDLRSAGSTVVLTTHDMDEAARLADQVVVIDHGTLKAVGTVEELTGGGQRSLEDAYVALTGEQVRA